MLNLSARPKKIERIVTGWAAFGEGWAVHAPTRESVLREYEDRVAFYRELLQRPDIAQSDGNYDGRIKG